MHKMIKIKDKNKSYYDRGKLDADKGFFYSGLLSGFICFGLLAGLYVILTNIAEAQEDFIPVDMYKEHVIDCKGKEETLFYTPIY